MLELAGEHALARDLVAGGVFVPGTTLTLNEECELILRGGGSELKLAAKCVWVDGDRGSGLQLVGCDAEMKQQIAAMAQIAEQPAQAIDVDPRPDETDGEQRDETDDEQAVDEGDDNQSDERGAKAKAHAATMHERLRHLTLAQQIKLAHTGEVSERIILERMYGKNVWEALLRNPRVTGPEVARIARMGSLPRPLVEIIVGNGGWLQIPEVRRALLSNPRLGTDQILRILRLLPRHELKLAGMQTAYPVAVREAAKRILRDAAG